MKLEKKSFSHSRKTCNLAFRHHIVCFHTNELFFLILELQKKNTFYNMYVRCLCNVLMNNIYFKFRFTNPCHSRSTVGNFPCEFRHYKQKPVRRGGQTQRTAYKTHAYLPAIPAMASDAEYLTSISLSIVSFSRTGLTWG
jgi:hypothetical protein